MDELVRRSGQVTVPADSRVDVSAHGFWKWGTTAIFDGIIVNLDVGSYLCTTPEKDLAKAEKDKKDLYLQDFLERRRYFTPMVYSADRITRAEDFYAHKRLAALLRFNLKREYYELCGFLRARISLATVRSNSLLLCGLQDTEARIRQRTELIYGAVMVLLALWRA